MEMKRYLLAFWLIVTNLVVLQADPACQDSICIVQPNGDTLWTYLHGDEFYHWRSTIDGHVIMRDSSNYFRYATIAEDSVLRPSTVIAHNAEERHLLEQEYLNIHTEAIQQYIDSEIDRTYSIVLSDTLIYPPIKRVASELTERQPVIGTRKILTILMDFKDCSFTRTREEFDSLMNQRSGAVGPNYGSVRQYYQENSYGQLEIQATVVGPFRALSKRSYYDYKASDNFWDWSVDIRQLVREAINHAKAIVDFSTLDGDNDGFADCIHVVFAGEGLSSGSTNSYIWPHKSRLSSPIQQNGIKAETYIITPELQLKGQLAAMGTICHEIGHVFGAPDFYDKKEKFHAMGKYDIMDSGCKNGNGGNPSIEECGYCPSHHNPYTKSYIFKWVTPQVIDSTNKTYVLKSSAQNKNQIYRIETQTQGEFFLLENRMKQGFDSNIPNEGLLIYHAHSDLESSIERNDSINGQHPLKLYLINAAADVNPREGSYGNRADERAFPTSTWSNKTMFTSTSTPNANAWDGRTTGVDICFIKQLDYGSIAFTVNPTIEGPSQLCGTQYYDIYGQIPDSDTISWGYVTNFDYHPLFPGLRFLDGKQGTPITIERGYQIGELVDWDTLPQYPATPMHSVPMETNSTYGQLPYVGEVLLYATITSANGSHTIEKTVELPAYIQPEINPLYTPLLYVNQPATLTESKCDNIDEQYIKWYVRYPNTETDVVYSGKSITITPTEAGILTIRIVNDCSCSQRSENTYNITVTGRIMSFPNPVTTSTLPIEIDFEGNAARSSSRTTTSHTVELWSEQLGRVRAAKVDGSLINMDVSGLPNGWYQILLIEGEGNILESNLIYVNL